LRQAIGFLCSDDLEFIECQVGNLGIGQFDGLDRDTRIVEEAQGFRIGVLGSALPGVGSDGPCPWNGRSGVLRDDQCLAQAHLKRYIEHTLLALLAEDLATEPVQLMLEGGHLLCQLDKLTSLIDDLPWRECRGFFKRRDSRKRV